MTIKDHLVMGRQRVASGWCIQQLAVDMYGNPTMPDEGNAVGWCARGAVWDGGVNFEAERYLHAALPDAWKPMFHSSVGDAVVYFNNSSSQVDVLMLFDRAIAMYDAGIAPDIVDNSSRAWFYTASTPPAVSVASWWTALGAVSTTPDWEKMAGPPFPLLEGEVAKEEVAA